MKIALALFLFVASLAYGQSDQSVMLDWSPTNYQFSIVATNTTWLVRPRGNSDLSPHLPPGQFKKLSNLNLYTFQDKENHARGVIANLIRRGLIEFVEPDHVISVKGSPVIPNDPYWTNQYDMPLIGMTNAWNFSTNAGTVVVAVIDTGIDFTNPDLEPNLWSNPTNGTHGYQCFNGVLQEGGADNYGHGTHCAGTIAARGNNAIGLAGVNWTNVQLMAMSFVGASGQGNYSDSVILIDQLLTLKSNGVPIYVTSNSYGSFGVSESERLAFLAMEQAGILSVCAAGNNGLSLDLGAFFPGGMTNRGIICVGASDTNDTMANFSNFGMVSVDICAPGVNIFSTFPTNANDALNDPSGYGFLSGTSMATPHVAGEAAFLKSLYPGLTVYQLKDTILHRGNYDPMQDAQGGQTETAGRINVASSLINSYIRSGLTNTPPTATPGALADSVIQGTPITFSITASDPDGDPLRYAIYDLNGAFPTSTNASFTWGSTNWAVDNALNVQEKVLDGNGGSASGQSYVNLRIDPSFIIDYYAITSRASLTSSNTGPPEFLPYALSETDLLTNSKPSVPVKMLLSFCRKGAVNANWWVPSDQPYIAQLRDTNGIYGLKVLALNSELTLTNYPVIVLHTGTDSSSTNVLPRLSVTLSGTRGIVPFTFSYDASSSYFPNGFASTNGSYFFRYFPDPDKLGATYTTPLTGQITVTDPGVHIYQFVYTDWATLQTDVTSFQIVALAPFSSPCNR